MCYSFVVKRLLGWQRASIACVNLALTNAIDNNGENTICYCLATIGNLSNDCHLTQYKKVRLKRESLTKVQKRYWLLIADNSANSANSPNSPNSANSTHNKSIHTNVRELLYQTPDYWMLCVFCVCAHLKI
jgi:hypothetical protein